MVASSRRGKQNIADLSLRARDVILGAPAKKWEYRTRPERIEWREVPDDSDPRFPRFRWENRTVPADTPTPHVGPLAEDLEAVAPWLVEGEGEDLTEDLRDLIGWLWGEAQDAIGSGMRSPRRSVRCSTCSRRMTSPTLDSANRKKSRSSPTPSNDRAPLPATCGLEWGSIGDSGLDLGHDGLRPTSQVVTSAVPLGEQGGGERRESSASTGRGELGHSLDRGCREMGAIWFASC